MADSMIGEIITDHRERMINLKKYYPFFQAYGRILRTV